MVNKLSGQRGELRYSYLRAASVSGWSVVTTESGHYALTATVTEVDTFRVSQQPIVFVAPHAHGAWRWRVDTLQIEGAVLTASLGPRE